jgi:hypothetical protein
MPTHTKAHRKQNKERLGRFVKKIKRGVEDAFNIGEEKPPKKIQRATFMHSRELADRAAKKGELTEKDIEEVTTPKKKKKKKKVP